MRGLLSLALAGALAVGITAAAKADNPPPAEKRAPHVGDAFDVADRWASIACKHWEVKQLNENGFLILQCGDKLAYLAIDHDYNLAKIVDGKGDTLVQFKPYAPAITFPLQVGKKWEGKYSGYTADNGYRWVSQVKCEVKAFETVKVAAGEFPSYRIECEDKAEMGGYTGWSHSQSWYAPAASVVVKNLNQEHGEWNLEVTRLSAAK